MIKGVGYRHAKGHRLIVVMVLFVVCQVDGVLRMLIIRYVIGKDIRIASGQCVGHEYRIAVVVGSKSVHGI